jgi:hypothetical protein
MPGDQLPHIHRVHARRTNGLQAEIDVFVGTAKFWLHANAPRSFEKNIRRRFLFFTISLVTMAAKRCRIFNRSSTVPMIFSGPPYAVLIGVMATFLTIIPFLGAITTCVTELITAVVAFGD